MACSINGLIAEEDGNEDFLSDRNYEIMLEILKEYDVLVWGRKTFDNVMSWGENYLEDLQNSNVAILSKNNTKEVNLNNITYHKSLENCLSFCKKNNYNKILVSGGAIVNNLFMENNIVDKIILNYNPYVLNRGIPMFRGEYFKNNLKLNKIVTESKGIAQIHYDVLK